MLKYKASYLKIAFFILGGVCLLLIATFSISKKKLFAASSVFYLRFDDSVNGLELGSPVKFKGVRIGYVENIWLRFNSQKKIFETLIRIRILEDAFVEYPSSVKDFKQALLLLKAEIPKGLRARLSYQSYLTGRLFIELDYVDDLNLASTTELTNLPQIPTIGSPLKKVWDAFVKGMNKVDFENISRLLSNLAKTADVLFAKLNDFPLDNIGTRLRDTLEAIEKIFREPDLTEAISSIKISATNLSRFSQTGQNVFESLEQETKKLSQKARQALTHFNNFCLNAEDFVHPASEQRFFLTQTLKDLSEITRSLKVLSETLERYPNALVIGKPQE